MMTNSEQNKSPTSDLINTENQSIQSSQTIKPCHEKDWGVLNFARKDVTCYGIYLCI